MSRDVLGYYRILNVDSRADIEQIKSNYRDLAKFWHPDRNAAPESMEKFQKLSEAWNVLQDDDNRLIYDILSAVYEADNYPDLDNIRPYNDGELDIRALSLCKVRGQIWKSRCQTEIEVCAYRPALAKHFKTAAANWLLGWWSPQALGQNVKALLGNFRQPVSAAESLRVLIHNTVAYFFEDKADLAVASAVRALPYADADTAELLQEFIRAQNLRVAKPMVWSEWRLRLVQLAVPMLLGLAALASLGSVYVSEGELWQWFAGKNEINYYQEVRFQNRNRGVDDVVVGKILNIPVDRRDVSRLYHLKAETEVMYGPGDGFDILKKLPAATTVRLTGISPDQIWSRVMIDNGEMGFVHSDALAAGIGKEIPYGSKIFEK